MLLIVGLSGCLENSETSGENDESDTIEIVDYEVIKKRYLHWDERLPGWMSSFPHETIVPWDLDISDIDTNLNKRQYICENYIATNRSFTVEENGEYVSLPGSEVMIWTEDYWSYSTISNDKKTTLSNFRLGGSIHSLKIKGTAKNNANREIINPEITVNLYDSNDNHLDSASKSFENKSAGATWDFSITYYGQYKENVDHVSFSTKEEP